MVHMLQGRNTGRLIDMATSELDRERDHLPNNLDNLRTGTSNDGWPLIKVPEGTTYESVLADIQSRLIGSKWRAEVYETTGIDVVLTYT